jgi:hypothetical protein
MLSTPTHERALFDRRDAFAVGALLLLSVVVLWPMLFAPAGTAPGLPGHDGRTQWLPWRTYAADWMKQGVLPLWNPHALCGTPFLGNAQSALFYPPNLLYLVLPVQIAARALFLFHIALSIVFTYLLGRVFGCRWPGAAAAAMVFGFGSAQLLRIPAGHWGVSGAIPWMPLLFLSVELFWRRPGAAPLVLGAVAVALQLLGGVPQVVFITGLAAGVFFLIRSVRDGLAWGERLRRWGGLVLVFLLGACLGGIQLLPGIEAARHGARSLPMMPEWIELFSLPPKMLATLLLPTVYGGPTTYRGPFLFWEMIAYAGVLTLPLALAGVLLRRRRGAALRWAALAVVMLALALGKHTPLMHLLHALPLSGMFRGAAKFLLPFQLGLAVAAGLGLTALLGKLRASRPEKVPQVVGLAVALLLALDFVHFGWSFIGPETMFPVADAVWRAEKAALLSGRPERAIVLGDPNLNDGMINDALLVEGIEPNPPVRFHRLFRRLQGQPETIAPSLYQVFRTDARMWPGIVRRMGVGRLFVERDTAVNLPRLRPLARGTSWRAYHVRDATPRAFVAYSARMIGPGVDPLEALGRVDARQTILLETADPAAVYRHTSTRAPTEATIVEQGPNHVVIDATAHAAGWLVLLDNYYPGWKATVDGAPAGILPANAAFRGVRLAPGRHRVVFRYEPLSLKLGLALSGAGLLLAAGLVVRARRRQGAEGQGSPATARPGGASNAGALEDGGEGLEGDLEIEPE